MASLEQLRNINVERNGLEELVELAAFGTILSTEFERQSIKAPEWLGDSLRVLGNEIASRRKDYLQKQLKLAMAKAEALKSREEQRSGVEAEIAELQKQLG